MASTPQRSTGEMRRIRWLLVLLIVAAALVALWTPVGANTRSFSTWMDLGHAPAFMLITFFVLRILASSAQPQRGWLLALGICLSLAIGSEAIQDWFGRHSNLRDLTANLLGVCGAAAAGWLAKANRYFWASLIGVLSITTASILPARILWDCYRQVREFPVLANFEDALELTRWTVASGTLELTPDHAVFGKRAALVRLQPANYPGIYLEHPPANWESYEFLVLEIHAHSNTEFLTLKIIDQMHNDQTWDRFHYRIQLTGQRQTIRIPLQAIRQSPRDRTFDLTRVAGLQLFASRPRATCIFTLDHIRLE